MSRLSSRGGDPPAVGDAPVTNPWTVLSILCLSLLVVSIDTSILNVALPTLVRDLDATPSQLQWIVDAYTLVFAGLLLTAGSLGDRLGRKRVMTAGLVLFGAASVGAAFASSPEQLIAWRALLGMGGALIMPATLSILVNVFTEPMQRGKAIAYWSLMNAMGAFIGPITGGLLLRHFSWGACFVVNVPFVVLALWLGRRRVPESHEPRSGPLRRARRRLVGGVVGRRAVGDHRGPREGLGRAGGDRRLLPGRRVVRGLHLVGAPHTDADDRPVDVP